MLKKHLSALRESMEGTFSSDDYQSNIKNWMLPFDHSNTLSPADKPFIDTTRVCKRLQTPFKTSLLEKEVGGKV